jgi:hypothetical protein
MKQHALFTAVSLAAIALSATPAAAQATLSFLGRYESGLVGGAEISAFDSPSERLFVTNPEWRLWPCKPVEVSAPLLSRPAYNSLAW